MVNERKLSVYTIVFKIKYFARYFFNIMESWLEENMPTKVWFMGKVKNDYRSTTNRLFNISSLTIQVVRDFILKTIAIFKIKTPVLI